MSGTYPLQRWHVGDVVVTKVTECVQKWPFEALLPGAGPGLIDSLPWLHPHFVNPDGRMLISFHTFVVESAGTTVLVDTCIGCDKTRTPKVFDHVQSELMDDLVAMGAAPDSVDRVFCTHLHVDHVGWNTTLVDDRWVPTFGNARYLVHRDEYDYWENTEQESGDVFGDSVRPLFDAGVGDLVGSDVEIAPGIRLEATIGHTPGHHCVVIESAGQRAVVTGDMVHHPVQLAHPELSSNADWDASRSAGTRREAFARWADGTLVLGTHFAGPTAGWLRADGDGWQLEIVPGETVGT